MTKGLEIVVYNGDTAEECFLSIGNHEDCVITIPIYEMYNFKYGDNNLLKESSGLLHWCICELFDFDDNDSFALSLEHQIIDKLVRGEIRRFYLYCKECSCFELRSKISVTFNKWFNRSENSNNVIQGLCTSCADKANFVHCYHCGALYYEDKFHSQKYRVRDGQDDEHRVLCPRCANKFYHHCDICCCMIPIEQATVFYLYEDDDDYEVYCCQNQTCHNHMLRRVKRNKVQQLIQAWNYKPVPRFIEKDGSMHTGEHLGKRYFGVEMELDCGDVDDFIYDSNLEAKEKGLDKLFYYMHDGSLTDGIEITTRPIVKEYALNGYPFELLYEQAKKHKMRSNNTKTCGLHIHVNRNSVNASSVAKLMYVFDRYYYELAQFGRRTSDRQRRRWCKKPSYNRTYFNECVENKLWNTLYNYADGCMKDHYCCVNTTPSETIEFRLWKGSHNPTVIRATIDMLNAILETCDNATWDELKDLDTWGKFLDTTSNYFELSETLDYLKQRKLL